MTQRACLNSHELATLLAGGLAEEEYRAAMAHVDSCASCQDSAAAAAEQALATASHLLAGQRSVFEQEQECAEVVDRVRGLHGKSAAETMPLSDTQTWPGSSRTSAEELPEMLGRYRVVRPLGRGGMGSVYLAHDTQLDRQVAVKVPDFGAGPHSQSAIQRFYREARAMATVRHPNLCPIYDVGESDGRPFIAMAYIEGQTLADRLAGEGPVDASTSAQLLRTLALAMDAVHTSGVLHRDLKPSNVMLDANGQPLITDFGLAARDHAGEEELTESSAVLGTPAYMAPEQVRGQHDRIGPHTDVYALGVILYQLLSGQRPFQGARLEVLGEIVSGKQPKPIAQYPGVDRRLASVCSKAMASKVEDRYETAKELADALAEYSEPRGSGTAVPSGRPWIVGAIAGAVVCALISLWAAGWFSPGSASRDREIATDSLSNDDSERTPTGEPDPDDAASRLATAGERQRPSKADDPSPPSTGSVQVNDPLFLDSDQMLGNGNSVHVFLSDLDEDGDPDAFVANYGGPDRVWWNDGQGIFKDSGQELGDSRSVRGAMGDLDGDKDVDVYVANVGGQPNHVLINEGGGVFRDDGQRLGNEGTKMVVLRDFDADGDLDALAANYHRTPANFLWLNDGHGKFTDSGRRIGQDSSSGVAAGDFDGDGDDDLFFANLGEAPNRLYRNGGQGNFTDSGQTLGRGSSNGVIAGDLDGDGDLDVLVANDGPNELWMNDGSGEFSPGEHPFESVYTNSAILADVDLDGDLDAVTANYGPNGLWLNDGSGRFNTVQWIGDEKTEGAALADLDGDGDLDLFFTNSPGLPNRVYFNTLVDQSEARAFHDSGQGLGTYASEHIVSEDVHADAGAATVVANVSRPNMVELSGGDGKPDLHRLNKSAARATRPQIPLSATLAPTLVPPTPAPTTRTEGRFFDSGQRLGTTPASGVSLGDLNGDGSIDAVVAGGGYSIWLNDGRGTFRFSGQEFGHSPMKFRRSSTALGDLDADGDFDLVVYGGDGNQLWLNDGTGRFTQGQQILSSGLVRLGDIDNDQDVDIVIVRYLRDCQLWQNDGRGRFENLGQPVADPTKICQFTLADVEDDGDLDIVLVRQNDERGNVWLNDGSGRFTERSQNLTGGSSNTWISLGDLDSDGDRDVFVSFHHSSVRTGDQLWWNDSNGGFTRHVSSTGLSQSSHHVLGDVDGDGDLDVVVDDTTTPSIVLLNDGSGELEDSGRPLGKEPVSCTALGDLDGDGDLDAFLAIDADNARSQVWFNGDGGATIHQEAHARSR